MIIVTNPGSNLSAADIAQHDIRLTPQQIIVDGEAHDTRDGVSFEQIDTWVKEAKTHPYVVGTTAAEFVQLFQQLAAEDDEIVAVMTSRKIIGSHDAAVVAANSLKKHPRYEHVRVIVSDSGVTDIGAGMACLAAAAARAAGGRSRPWLAWWRSSARTRRCSSPSRRSTIWSRAAARRPCARSWRTSWESAPSSASSTERCASSTR